MPSSLEDCLQSIDVAMTSRYRDPKLLIVGNYPPPMCGWAIQTFFVVAELRKRGEVCQVLKINENRKTKSSEYIDVQGGWDYLYKIARHLLCGYRVNVHVNGCSRKGYVLALITALVARVGLRPALITFHGGLPQDYFPRHDSRILECAFRTLFQLAGKIACDSLEVKTAIEDYRINSNKITPIPTFSPQYLSFTRVPLPRDAEAFLSSHRPLILSYLAFRREYHLDVLRTGMRQFCREHPKAGFVWAGFTNRELRSTRSFLESWSEEERKSVFLLGAVTHDEFLTLLTQCNAYLRSPVCDGVSASVLEALGVGVPVVASENGRRPRGVITYDAEDPTDMCSKIDLALLQVERNVENHDPKYLEYTDDNIAKMADWLLE